MIFSVQSASILLIGGCVLYHYMNCREKKVAHSREDVLPHVGVQDPPVATYNWHRVNNLDDPSVYDTEVKNS